jgi:hypothetical protein
MTGGKRFGLSAAQKSDVWRRWKAGDSLHEIGRAFGKEHSSIRCLVSRHGGFIPTVRRRSLLALTLWEREGISRTVPRTCRVRYFGKLGVFGVSSVTLNEYVTRFRCLHAVRSPPPLPFHFFQQVATLLSNKKPTS